MKKNNSLYNKLVSAFLDKENFFYFENCIAALASGFILSSIISIIGNNQKFTSLEYVKSVSPIFFILLTLLAAAGLLLLSKAGNNKKMVPYSLIVLGTILGMILTGTIGTDIWFNLGVAVVIFIITAWVTKKEYSPGFADAKLTYKHNLIIGTVLFLIFTIVVFSMSNYRYKSYGAATFDFGIFAQMFEFMKNTGKALTTVERNTLLSHFSVHFSPFYYLLLPGYMLFSSPSYLLFIQAAAIGSGVFAVMLICKALGLSPKEGLFFMCTYILYPSLSYGCIYDFHENKFLTVCLLWTIYFLVSNKNIGLIIAAFVTCSIKEDAAIYIISIAFFIIIHDKKLIKGLSLAIIALLWFALGMWYLGTYGEGAMNYRYSNFDLGEGSVYSSIIKTVLLDIGYGIQQVFTSDKFGFMLWMFLPVGMMPFFSKKISIYLLFIPMLIVNLLSSWQYQYNIYYQYTFGVAALIFFAAIIVFKEMSPKVKQKFMMFSLSICIIITIPLINTNYNLYKSRYNNDKEKYSVTADIIYDTIPKDASVVANTYMTAVMYEYTNIYNYPCESVDCEYVVIDTRNTNGLDALESYADYNIVAEGGICKILKKP